MTFGERKKAIRYFEESRGNVFRNLSYAGIAASWTLRQETAGLSAFLVLALVLFSLYLASDGYYIHQMALKEREQYLELEAAHKNKNKNEVPGDEVLAPYDRRKVQGDERFPNWKIVILGSAYACLVCGASGILAKLWS
jgi:hypothetical protein